MNNIDKRLEVTIKDMVLRNPVMTASGTFGYGYDYEDFMNLESLGGIVVKATTGANREGNAYPRMAETSSGMLNAVGLQNKGVDYFCNTLYNKIKDINTNMIVNVSGSSIEEYVEVAEKINELKNIPGIELNISCPNVKQGGMAFGTDPKMAAEVVKAVRRAYNKTLIVKLSPNVTSIVEIAKAVEGEGADSLSLINTLFGMAVDAEKRQPLLSTVTGGLSGPAVKPVALRCVWQVAKQTKLPLIGIGGIMNATDAIEFILVGATAIEVGTANFINPAISQEIVYGISEYLDRHNIKNISDIRGII
ncbi:MAG TPA: dihydroorotate dehydrogenase [Bacteroidales bacterium]|nr:dihydroorotate dehydrogenase [Bacteroidales bacterium]